MRSFTLALLLASVSFVPAFAQRDHGDERIQGIDEGRQARAERMAERAAEVQSQRQEAPAQVEVAQRRDRGDNGGNGGGWQGRSDQGPTIRQPEAQAQAQPQPVPQAQARGNWDGNGGNRGWRGQNRGADVNNARVMNRDWRGNREGNQQGDSNRRWQDRADRQPSGQTNPQAVPPVAQRDGRDWNRNRDDHGWNHNDRNRDVRNNNGRDNGGRDNRNWNDNRDGHVWNRGDNGRWERRGNDRNWNSGQRWGDNRWNDGRRWNNNQNWNNQWRNDRRYDWQRHRQSYRNQYRQDRYYNPYGNRYGYQRFGIGVYLDSLFFGNNYWLDDPYQYRLPTAPYGTRWVRYYDDVLLVDIRTGYVIDVINDFFW